MKALILQESQEKKIEIQEIAKPTLQAGEALIKLKASALNHRDQWCRVGMYPGLRYPSVLGSDGCGVVEEVADAKDAHWVGKTVILNPNVNWGNHPDYQQLNYTILGMPTAGTFAEWVAVPVHRLHEKPSHLSDEEAAALPLAGLTAYRAVFTKGKVKKDDAVLVTGIGGGVALFAFQFAHAAGAKVYITSSNDEKIATVVGLGAKMGVNYKQENWQKELTRKEYMGFQAIIDGAGGEDFGKLATLIAPAGTLVVYGTTAGKPSAIQLPRLFFSQATITGTTMGNDEEFAAMVAFVAQHQIKPIVSSVRPFDQIVSALDEMDAGKQFGKLVVSFV